MPPQRHKVPCSHCRQSVGLTDAQVAQFKRQASVDVPQCPFCKQGFTYAAVAARRPPGEPVPEDSLLMPPRDGKRADLPALPVAVGGPAGLEVPPLPPPPPRLPDAPDFRRRTSAQPEVASPGFARRLTGGPAAPVQPEPQGPVLVPQRKETIGLGQRWKRLSNKQQFGVLGVVIALMALVMWLFRDLL